MNRSQELGERSIFSLLMKFSIPAMVGMIVNALYNVVDRIFVGQGVGSLAIAGITVCFPLFAVNMAFSMLIGIGGAALISIRLGQKKQGGRNCPVQRTDCFAFSCCYHDSIRPDIY